MATPKKIKITDEQQIPITAVKWIRMLLRKKHFMLESLRNTILILHFNFSQTNILPKSLGKITFRRNSCLCCWSTGR